LSERLVTKRESIECFPGSVFQLSLIT